MLIPLVIVLDEYQSIKRLVFNPQSARGGAFDEGFGIFVIISQADVSCTGEGVNVHQPERLVLQRGGICVQIVFQDFKFLDSPVPAKVGGR